MVKKAVNICILILFVVRLVTLQWPLDIASILVLLSVIIISVAAGFAAANLMHKEEEK